ncbi:LysR family transcriptional regulator [Sapientia aquatica]|uniref:LysR family transcriptional regulator n=1 Tax=Sapientia aquatica TaxID=1549640 RepID=A0A4V3ATE9_9BURK|nr:LysR family transcriptional regulator [Sapientia aquatica]TDK59656.1 LysR family transcriptional regulator [Sapientia aquatica]
MRIPSLRLLSGFEAAARLGNFSRAADELHLSQSAVSHQILQLEEQVGMPLFRRTGRGVELTVAGEVLQRSVLRSLESLKSGLGRIETYLNPGIVTIVCPAPILHGWLQSRIEQLQLAIPSLCPVLSVDETARYIDEDDVDIMISNRPIQQAGLVEVPFLQDEWVVVANALSAKRLAGIPIEKHHRETTLVCLEESLTNDEIASIFRNQLNGFKKSALYDDQRLLLDAVIRGRGIACLPFLLASDEIKRGNLVILRDYPRVPSTTWWISRIADQPRADIVIETVDWLLAQSNLK